MIVDLEKQDWDQIMSIIGSTRDFPWTVTNPLLMKIGQQLQAQKDAPRPTTDAFSRMMTQSRAKGDGKEVDDGQ